MHFGEVIFFRSSSRPPRTSQQVATVVCFRHDAFKLTGTLWLDSLLLLTL